MTTNGGLSYFDKDSDLIDIGQLPDSVVEECMAVMRALRDWREADRALSEASRRYMKLNDSDMRAIRMIIRAQKQGALVTPKNIANEVGISGASTTKLIDRLVAGGHVVRTPHPSDRRTMCIEVTEHTARSAHDTVGRQHARRFDAIAQLSSSDREAVIRFLDGLRLADTPIGELAGDAVEDPGKGHGSDAPGHVV